ncbi:MAG TPA: plastocyanin/azurin family copper-binding protein [Polyangiaceae bacterium]|nr:plastocyanin/azurin family copper-binding protein [Polyangiaceae bacterium]
MSFFGERFAFSVPLLLALGAVSACGDETNNVTIVLDDAGTTINPIDTGVVATTVTVDIPANAMALGRAAYGTNPLVVAPGTTVRWVNQDSVAHTATSDSGVWDSGTLTQGQSFNFTFTTPGTFPYHCTIHGAASMSGVVVVQ